MAFEWSGDIASPSKMSDTNITFTDLDKNNEGIILWVIPICRLIFYWR